MQIASVDLIYHMVNINETMVLMTVLWLLLYKTSTLVKGRGMAQKRRFSKSPARSILYCRGRRPARFFKNAQRAVKKRIYYPNVLWSYFEIYCWAVEDICARRRFAKSPQTFGAYSETGFFGGNWQTKHARMSVGFLSGFG